MAGRNYCYIWT